MKRWRRLTGCAFVCVLLLMITVGCGADDVPGQMDEFTGQFADGKTEEDYSLKTSARELSMLIDDYSGSLEVPKGIPMTPDEAEAVRGDSSGNEGSGDGSDGADQGNGIPVVGDEKEYIRLIHQALLNQEDHVTFQVASGVPIDVDKLGEILKNIEREDPLCLSISNLTYGYYITGSEVTYTFTCAIPKDEMTRMRNETQKAVRQAAGEIDTSGKSAYEIVSAVNEYLCDKVEYPVGSVYEPAAYTGYGALIDGSAVCEGYSIAAKLLLNELKIPCDIEFGDCIGGGGHAWNLVQVDGSWYQMDITWNDAAYDRKAYFLTTDDEMKKSRTWDESLYPSTPDEAYAA